MPKLVKTIFILALAVAGGQHNFGVNGMPILCVPDSDMDPLLKSYADESTHLRTGSGQTPGFSFLFRPETIKSIIPEYVLVPGFDGHPYANTLSGSVGFLGQDDRHRLGPAMRARAIGDEWYARGECPRPIFRSLSDQGLYEVKCNAEADYASIWSRLPDPNMSMPNPDEFVVATCQFESIRIGPYKGGKLKKCVRVGIVEDFLIEYRFLEENAPVIPEIDSIIRQKLASWKRNCSSPT